MIAPRLHITRSPVFDIDLDPMIDALCRLRDAVDELYPVVQEFVENLPDSEIDQLPENFSDGFGRS